MNTNILQNNVMDAYLLSFLNLSEVEQLKSVSKHYNNLCLEVLKKRDFDKDYVDNVLFNDIIEDSNIPNIAEKNLNDIIFYINYLIDSGKKIQWCFIENILFIKKNKDIDLITHYRLFIILLKGFYKYIKRNKWNARSRMADFMFETPILITRTTKDILKYKNNPTNIYYLTISKNLIIKNHNYIISKMLN